jgi:hypothetical protein
VDAAPKAAGAVITRLLNLDPSTSTVVLALWALSNAGPLFFPDWMVATPLYEALEDRVMPIWAWATLLVSLSVGMLIVVGIDSHALRLAVMCACAWVWITLGIWVQIYIYRESGMLAGGALFWIFGGVMCLLASQQWAVDRA